MCKFLTVLVGSMLITLLSGQGCPTAPFGPESPRDRAWRICNDGLGMSGDNFDSLYSVAELDHNHGFGKWDEVNSAFGGCDSGCSGIDWCVNGCHDCSLAVVDAVYGSSSTAKQALIDKANSTEAVPTLGEKFRQIAADRKRN